MANSPDSNQPVAWAHKTHPKFWTEKKPADFILDQWTPLYAHPAAPAPDDARDAARYRRIRTTAYVREGRWQIMGPPTSQGSGPNHAERFDAAIDAAQ